VPEGVIAQALAPQFSSSQAVIWLWRWPRPPGGTPILIRTGKRRSADVIMSRGLPGMYVPSLFLNIACSRRHVQRLGAARPVRYGRLMCGRVRLSSDVSEIKLVFSIPPHRPTPNFPPSWNVAPTDPLPVVRYDRRVGERSLDILRWGLIPHWAKDINVGFANINAKAEGIENRPAFRDAFQHRRCLVGRSITSMSGRRRRPASSLMPSPSRIGA
jgi:SOS response associated peptidase (SRAP)